MIKFIRRLGYQFKEYLLLTLLIIISLFFISNSEKPQAKQLKLFAMVGFAMVDELFDSVVSIFQKDISLEELRKENAELMLQLNKMRNQVREVNELSAMLSMRDTSRYPLIPVKVVSKLVSKFQGNYIINRGLDSGIQKGMPVVSNSGLVGSVYDVDDNYSVIRTLYNVNMNIAVTIRRSKVDGVLSYNGRDLVIKDIPTTYDVKQGDAVEISDFSTVFPPSIPVGIIQKKLSNPLGLLHDLTVKSYASIEGANNLFVIKVIPSKQINQLEMNLMKKP